MYDFLDRPVTSLDHGGRFLIWSMRNWVRARINNTCPANALAKAFEKWSMLPGLHPFLRMMALLNRHGLANFEFCALNCNHISEHEAIILSLMGSLQDRPAGAIHATISLLVEEECIGDVVVVISEIRKAMDRAGIHPGPPMDAAGRSCQGR